MSDQQEPGYFEQVEAEVHQYIDNRLQLVKFQATETASRLVTLALVAVVICVLAFLVLLFLSIMGAYYFSELTGSLFYGFGIITCFYLFMLILILILKKPVITPFFQNMLIRIFLDHKNEKDEADNHPES